MSKLFLNLVAIVFVAVGFVACSSDDKLSASDSELLRSARGYFDGVKYQVLKQGANINAKDKDGRTALMLTEQLEIAKFLIEQGADVNAKDKKGWTALMLTTQIDSWKRLEWVKLLIEKGADVNAKDKNGLTALMHHAYVDSWDIEILKLLIEKGADINAKNKDGYTAVDLAGHMTKGILLKAAGIGE